MVADLSRPLAERMRAQLDLAPGGVMINDRQVSYFDGAAIVTLPESVVIPPEGGADRQALADSQTLADSQAPAGSRALEAWGADAHGCPTELFGNDWYCFYEHSQWGGRRVQWNAPHCTAPVSLAAVGMSNTVSSWDNAGGLVIRVYDTVAGSGWLWTERPHSASSYVGATANDRASSFTACPS